MVRIIIWLKCQWENLMLYNAKRTADKLHAETGRKYIVFWFKGRPKVWAKQELKNSQKGGGMPKGITTQIIENNALYITE